MPLTLYDLLAFCRQKLASFKVPRGIEVVEALPKNALGKVMRHVLRAEVTSKLTGAVQELLQ